MINVEVIVVNITYGKSHLWTLDKGQDICMISKSLCTVCLLAVRSSTVTMKGRTQTPSTGRWVDRCPEKSTTLLMLCSTQEWKT
jgi:hypothetical protein